MEALWAPLLPAHKRAVALATNGKLGEPLHLSMDFGSPHARVDTPPLFDPVDGGVLLDRMIYPVSLAITLFGEVADMDAAIIMEGEIDTRASLQLRHKGGGVSQLSSSIVSLMSNAARIACTRGVICIEEPVVGAETLSIRGFAPHASNAAAKALTAPSPAASLRSALRARLKTSAIMRRVNRAVTAPRHETHAYGPNQYSPRLAHFADLVLQKKTESDVWPLARSLEMQTLLPATKEVGLARRRHGARKNAEADSPAVLD